MPEFNRILDQIKKNTATLGGSITLVLDFLLVIAVFLLFFKVVKSKIKLSFLIGISFGFILLYAISYIFGLNMFLSILKFIVFFGFGILIVSYSQDIRHTIDTNIASTKVNNVFSSKQEKDDVIKTLCNAARQLSDRSVGALITIEKEDSLTTFIEKSIPIQSVITQELITTIFTPGTPCHDGAMIIRKDRIMCAGAYLPTSEKYDIPKYLGTRHRAAIGISERYDSVTIVVSEETGNISLTADGVINLDLSIERLEEMLDKYLLNK